MPYRIKLDPKSRKAARFISQTQKKIQKAFIDSGKSEEYVAENLSIDVPTLRRRLYGGSGVSLRFLAELTYVLEKNIYIEIMD